MDIRRNCFTEMAVKHWNRLEVFEERLDTTPGLVNKVAITQRLDLIISEVFTNLNDSVIVKSEPCS